MYTVNINHVPLCLQFVTPEISVYTNNTRSAARGALYTYNANLKYFTKSVKYEGARLWNKLYTIITFTPSIAVFKQSYVNDYFNI